jgi:hypothetical protein
LDLKGSYAELVHSQLEDDTHDLPLNAALVVSSNGHESSGLSFQAARGLLQISDKGGRNGFNHLGTPAPAKEIGRAGDDPPD